MGRGNDKSGMNKMSYGILGTGATCISNARQHVSIGRLPLDSQCDVWPPSHDLYAFRRLILLLIFFFLYPVMFVLLSIFRLHPSAQQRSIFPRTFFLKYNKKRKKISNIACLRHQSHPLVARRDVPSLLLFLFWFIYLLSYFYSFYDQLTGGAASSTRESLHWRRRPMPTSTAPNLRHRRKCSSHAARSASLPSSALRQPTAPFRPSPVATRRHPLILSRRLWRPMPGLPDHPAAAQSPRWRW